MPPKKKEEKLKIPPHNLEAEQSVLGCILIDHNAIFKIIDTLGPKDFYMPAHEKIYDAVIELFEKSQPIDILSVTNLLKEKGILQELGGSAYLADLTNQITTASHIDHYCRIVKEKKTLRDLIKVSGEITESAFEGSKDIEVLLDSIESKILSISQKSLQQNFVHVREELKEAYERIENLHAHKGALRGVGTGFDKLDSLLSGLQKSNLIVLGARPSLGKTSLALDIARGAARSGVPVGIFSLEMSREEVIDRLISAESNVPLWQLRTGYITDDMQFAMIQQGLDKLSKVPIFVDDTPAPNILQMRAMARRLQVENGLGLLIVDYLQLIRPRRPNDNMVTQVTEISRGLKQLARELQIPVLAISQLSRAVDQRDDSIPKLHDLRDSGSIEQDADVVMFIYRKDRYKTDLPPEEQNIAQISVAKHRNGPLGVVKVRFDSERASFKDIEERYAEPVGVEN